MKPKSVLKISRTWSFNSKVSKVFDNHVRKSIPLYNEFHKQMSNLAEVLIVKSFSIEITWDVFF